MEIYFVIIHNKLCKNVVARLCEVRSNEKGRYFFTSCCHSTAWWRHQHCSCNCLIFIFVSFHDCLKSSLPCWLMCKESEVPPPKFHTKHTLTNSFTLFSFHPWSSELGIKLICSPCTDLLLQCRYCDKLCTPTFPCSGMSHWMLIVHNYWREE